MLMREIPMRKAKKKKQNCIESLPILNTYIFNKPMQHSQNTS